MMSAQTNLLMTRAELMRASMREPTNPFLTRIPQNRPVHLETERYWDDSVLWTGLRKKSRFCCSICLLLDFFISKQASMNEKNSVFDRNVPPVEYAARTTQTASAVHLLPSRLRLFFVFFCRNKPKTFFTTVHFHTFEKKNFLAWQLGSWSRICHVKGDGIFALKTDGFRLWRV